MAKNVLNLNQKSAKKFFLSQECYLNIELPPYFKFDELLAEVDNESNSLILSEKDLKKAKKNETINHILYGNKDGKYAWRKYEIINPLMYVSLVNVITEKDNWDFLKNRFNEFQKDSNIECESIPVLAGTKSKQRASQILRWVNRIEKRSLALALEYKYLYQTDISDCYGSIYSHSLPWAIHTKETSKNNRGFNGLFGNKIDQHIQAMSYGETNGIPQGSTLMDFIAEIVLGYADMQLSDKLKKELREKKFHILRYRDDYRIFVNDVADGDIILKCLSEVLLNLGFRLNANKTSFSDDVIGGSIKKDKIDELRIEETPKKLSKKGLLRQLLIIQQLGKQFPNSGTVVRRLSHILDNVKPKDFYLQEKIIVSVLADIAYNNPNSFPLVAGLVSSCIAKVSKKEKGELLISIQKKVCLLPNAGLLEIWTQRIALGIKLKLELNEKLCCCVYDSNFKIFETNWIEYPRIKAIIDDGSYVDMDKIEKLKPIISNKEVQIFTYGG
ncbi:MAG: RNA-directed DNA polymerase [Candidatus Moraniibacteriota bacterium]